MLWKKKSRLNLYSKFNKWDSRAFDLKEPSHSLWKPDRQIRNQNSSYLCLVFKMSWCFLRMPNRQLPQNEQMLKGKWAQTSPRLMSGLGSNATCCGFSQRPTFQPFWVCKNQILQHFTIHSRTSLSKCLCCPKGSSFHLNRFSSHSLTSLFLRNICTDSLLFFCDIG